MRLGHGNVERIESDGELLRTHWRTFVFSRSVKFLDWMTQYLPSTKTLLQCFPNSVHGTLVFHSIPLRIQRESLK